MYQQLPQVSFPVGTPRIILDDTVGQPTPVAPEDLTKKRLRDDDSEGSEDGEMLDSPSSDYVATSIDDTDMANSSISEIGSAMIHAQEHEGGLDALEFGLTLLPPIQV